MRTARIATLLAPMVLGGCAAREGAPRTAPSVVYKGLEGSDSRSIIALLFAPERTHGIRVEMVSCPSDVKLAEDIAELAARESYAKVYYPGIMDDRTLELRKELGGRSSVDTTKCAKDQRVTIFGSAYYGRIGLTVLLDVPGQVRAQR